MLLKACIFPELKNNGKNTFPECTYHHQRGERLMKQRLQRILSILCILALLAGCVTVTAFAAEAEENVIKAIHVEWEDENNYEGLRPSSVIASIGTAEPITLNAGNGWSGETVAAASADWSLTGVPGGYAKSEFGNNIKTVIFRHQIARVPYKASVSWDNKGRTDVTPPAKVRINLLANGVVCSAPRKVTGGTNTELEWEGLPKYQKGTRTDEITYTVEPADKVAGYDASVSGSTVTYTLKTTDLTLTVALSGEPEGSDLSNCKVLVDGPDPSMPQTVSFGASSGGTKTFTFSNVVEGAYLARITNADSVVEDPEKYVINPSESRVGDGIYAASGEDNKLNVKYTWMKVQRQEPNEEPMAKAGELEFTIIGPDGFEQTLTFSDFDKDGEFTGSKTLSNLAPGTYIVIERNPEGLVDAYSLTSGSKTGLKLVVGKSSGDGEEDEEDSEILFNQYRQAPLPVEGKVDIPVVKIWNDNDDKDGNRPGSILVTLYADGVPVDEHTLTADEGWRFTFKDKDAYDEDANEITYTVTEEAVDWYTADINGTYITNNYKPDVTSVSVVKVWDDNDDALRRRPSSIAVTLLPVGDVYILSAENGWSATADNLPKKINGKAVNYSWSEQEVVGYVKAGASTSGSATTFTNRLPLIPEIPPDQPQPKTPGETWYYFGDYDTALGGNVLINHVGDCFD